jgi:hypothetical protein
MLPVLVFELFHSLALPFVEEHSLMAGKYYWHAEKHSIVWSMPLLLVIGTVLIMHTMALLQQHTCMVQHCSVSSYNNGGRFENPLF